MSHLQDRLTLIAVFPLNATLIVGVDDFEFIDARVKSDLNAANCNKDDSQHNG